MSKPRILVQLDSDPQPSVFDAVVAADCGVDHLFAYGSVTKDQVQGLVHGAMFTRGGEDLRHTAIFVGGSDVSQGETMLREVVDAFFGPVRVSVMMDASGANTTSAAAVVSARRHLDLSNSRALVLAATGPVGQRVVRLLCGEGAHVRAASRSRDRAEQLVEQCREAGGGEPEAVETSHQEGLRAALADVDLVIAAGAAGIELLPESVRQACPTLKVAIDLNAVPPLGIGGVDTMNRAQEVEGVLTYGAIGVGGTKMKLHKACLEQLFEGNDRVLDVDEIYQVALGLE